jgi:hypothetical protein
MMCRDLEFSSVSGVWMNWPVALTLKHLGNDVK